MNFASQLKLRQTRLAALEAALPALALRVAPSTPGQTYEDDTSRTLELAPRGRAPLPTGTLIIFFEDDAGAPVPATTVTAYHIYLDGVFLGDFDGAPFVFPDINLVFTLRGRRHGRHRLKLVAYNSQSTGTDRPIKLVIYANSTYSTPALDVFPNQATSDGDEQEFFFVS